MVASNEELMQAFVRTGRIMQHLDGPRCPHGPHGMHEFRGPHGRCGFHGPHDPQGPHGEHGPHGHGPHGPHGMCGPRGGRHGQARALSLIALQEGITQKDLAFLLGVRPQSAGEMLAKLEEYGLIERRKSESDARAIQLYLTEDGKTHAQEIDRMRKVVAEDVFSVLTEDEKAQLAVILEKLQSELEKYRPKPHEAPVPAQDADE